MNTFSEEFNTRQHMVDTDFELFHYRDSHMFKVDYHHHDFYEIFIFIRGGITYLVEGKPYELKPWDILLINGNDVHKPINHTAPGDIYERFVLWINRDFLVKHSDSDTNLLMWFDDVAQTKHNLLRPSSSEQAQGIVSMLTELKNTESSYSYGSSVLMTAYILRLIINMTRMFLKTYNEYPEIETNKDITRILDFINENISNELTLDIIASKFYQNKYTLLRNFKNLTGYTIHRYIQIKRLSFAKSLLQNGISVTEACSASGFGDYANFIRSFKKEFGMPPLRYARQKI